MSNAASARSGDRLLPITSIRRDGQTQHRSAKDPGLVAEYAALMECGVEFPPVTVWWDGQVFWLTDGFHRVAAAERLDFREISADIHRGDVMEARWDSYGANSAHGLRRTAEETKRVVGLALEHPKARALSNVELARHLHIPESTLRRWRKQLSGVDAEVAVRTVKRGAATYAIRTERIGKTCHRPRSKSRHDLRLELHRMKEHGNPKTRRVLNIVWNWIFNGSSPEECLKAIGLIV
jgi:hypothetical protein